MFTSQGMYISPFLQIYIVWHLNLNQVEDTHTFKTLKKTQ